MAFSPGTVRVWGFMRRSLLSFLKVNALCVTLSAVAGAVAHLIAANLTREMYSVAIGDTLLPSSPFESYLWGPLYIGALVSWWFGFIAAPLVFAATLYGSRRSWEQPIGWFILIGLVGWSISTGWAVAQHAGNPWPDLGTDVLIGILGFAGYIILMAAFIALTISRWRGKVKTASGVF